MNETPITDTHVAAITVLCDSHPTVDSRGFSAQLGSILTRILLLPGPWEGARRRFTARSLYAVASRAYALRRVLDLLPTWWAARPCYGVQLRALREVCQEVATGAPSPGERDARAFRSLLAAEIPEWGTVGGDPSLN